MALLWALQILHTMFAIKLDRELPHPVVNNYFVLNQEVKYDTRYSICDVKINNIQVESKVYTQNQTLYPYNYTFEGFIYV